MQTVYAVMMVVGSLIYSLFIESDVAGFLGSVSKYVPYLFFTAVIMYGFFSLRISPGDDEI